MQASQSLFGVTVARESKCESSHEAIGAYLLSVGVVRLDTSLLINIVNLPHT